jgi:hypothetical protein
MRCVFLWITRILQVSASLLALMLAYSGQMLVTKLVNDMRCITLLRRTKDKLYFILYSSVGMALGHGLDDQGSRVRFPVGMGIFLFTTASRTALEPTQHIQWVLGAL